MGEGCNGKQADLHIDNNNTVKNSGTPPDMKKV